MFSVDKSVRRYLDSSKTGSIVLTVALQNSRHREEQDTLISYSMNVGKLNIQAWPIGVLE